MSKHNSGIHEALEIRSQGGSPVLGLAILLGRISRYFGIPILLLYLFGPRSEEFSRAVLNVYFMIAVPISLAAISLRWWALGYVREQAFIVNGPYRYVRNPVELSCVLGYTAGAILLRFPWWYTLAIGALAVLHMSLIAISYDKTLIQKHGTQYLRYAQRVRRWVPSSLPATNSQRPDFCLTRAVMGDARIWVWGAAFLAVFALRFRWGSLVSWSL